MKRIKVFMMLAFAAVCTSVNAQESFSTIYAQYNIANSKSSNDEHSESTSMTSFSVGYSYDISVSPDVPFYVEIGAGIQYWTKSKNDYTSNLLALKVPVNAVYAIPVSDNFSIEPYAGLFARFNILATNKFDGETTNLFSKDDVGEHTANRFQFGFQAGVRARINQAFLIGVGYCMDLNSFQDIHDTKTKMNSIDITLGYCF